MLRALDDLERAVSQLVKKTRGTDQRYQNGEQRNPRRGHRRRRREPYRSQTPPAPLEQALNTCRKVGVITIHSAGLFGAHRSVSAGVRTDRAAAQTDTTNTAIPMP